MELDPFLALDHPTPTTSASAPDPVDPVASLLGEDHHESAPAVAVAIDRSSPPRSAAAAESSNDAASASNSEPACADLNEQLATLLLANSLPQSTITSLQTTLRENATLKDKNAKLKSLLGRSAKAQRDAKHELEQFKKQHEQTERERERLERRVEQLANRPTHMDLLADFETNFDRALLSVGNREGQSGGEDAAERTFGGSFVDVEGYRDESSAPSRSAASNRRGSDALLLNELAESKSRIAHLESLQSSLQNRNAHLERTHRALSSELQSAKNSLSNLHLELRMSKMETDHALRTLREKEATMTEMQLEIDLVARSAAEANKRAAEGMEAARSVKFDRDYVEGLEAKVSALQEWALASTESKRLTSERARGLEERVRELEEMVSMLSAGEGAEDSFVGEAEGVPRLTLKRAPSSSAVATEAASAPERKLWTKSSSLVVGAGMVGHAFLELGQQELQIQPYETVVLRWKFDLTPSDLDVYFSVLKGLCGDKKSQRSADACFRNRHVQGGGGGEVSGAFAVQNACTLVWSNEMSWVRPRTIKWSVDAVAIEWSD